MILDALAQLIRSGWICVAAIGLIWLETAMIARYRPSLRSAMVANALAGTFLLAALASALIDAHLFWTGLALAAAFAAHLFDLAYRLRDSASEFNRSTE